MEASKNFTEGKILSPLIKFAIPVLFAIFLQTMYGAVDMLIVGRFCSPADVSAVSTGSNIMHGITAAITGIAMGTTILLGQKIGEKKAHEGGRVIGCSIFLFGILALLVTVGIQIFAPLTARAMQAPQEAFAATVAYVKISGIGTIFIVAYNILGSIFRGIGNSKIPLYAVAIACVFNIVGDLIFVGPLKMGAAGAAIATVMAQALSVILSMIIIKKQRLPFTISIKDVKYDKEFLPKVVKLGLPIALQDVLVSISFLVIAAIVNSFGVIASAGVGVAGRITGFILIVPAAYMQAMSAFVAQNMGAKKPERAQKALVYSIATSLGVGVFLSYFSFFHGDLLAGVFARDTQVILAAADYLKAFAIDCLLVSFMFCFIGYFNGCGKTTFVMLQGIVGAFCVRIPFSYMMSKVVPMSLFKLGLATPAATFIQIILCGGYFILLRYAKKNNTMNV